MGRGDRSRRVGRWAQVTVVGLFGSAAVVAVPSAAHAENTITVTTTADVVNGGDGVTSLREAFTLATTDGDDSVIELSPDATYSLSICVPKVPIDYGTGFFGSPADDDANADGDLDHTASHDLTIEGNGATITNTCQYDRVIDNLDSSSWLTLHDVTVTGGDSPPGEAVAVGSPGGATLDGVRIEDSTRTIGSAIAAVAVGDPSGAGGIVPRLEMTDTVIVASGSNGVRVDWGTSTITDSAIYDAPADGVSFSHGTMTISGSTFVDNGGNGVSGIDGALYVTDSVAGGNGGAGFRTTGNAASGYPLHLDGVRAIQNGTGVDCSYCTDLLIENSTISLSGGNGVRAIANLAGPTFHIENSSITDNDATAAYFSGGAITMTADPPAAPTLEIVRSTLSGNESKAASAGGAIWLHGFDLDIDSSTLSDNTADAAGGAVAIDGPGSVTVRASTIADNVGGSGGDNLAVGAGGLTMGSTVLATGPGGTNCSGVVVFTSLGSNQITDTSCGTGGQPGDVVPAGDPLLDPLADNGGPTWTRMPQAASPLVDAVAPAACASSTPDQRGVERPVGSACDIGAVERDLDARVALVVPDLTSVTPSTDAIARWLGARELQVFLVDDDDSLARATAGASLIVVAGRVDAERVATQLARSTQPIIVNDAPSIRAFGLGDAQVIKNVSKVVVPSSTSRTGSSKIRIARRPIALAATKAASTATVFAIVNGKGNPAVAFRADQDSRVRIALFLDEGVPELLTEDGWGVATTALESISHAA